MGEIWGDAREWLQGQHFDGVMNYRLGWSSLGWVAGDRLRQGYRNPEYPLNPLSSEELIDIWSTTSGWYRPAVNRAQMNLLDSHDVPRALHSLNGDVKALKLALLLLFLQPGAPCVYYGTEAALAGGPDAEQSGGPEPACREAFPWGEPWAADLRSTIAGLADLRRNHPNLIRGDLQWQPTGRDGMLGRTSGGLSVWVNRSTSQSLEIRPGTSTIWTCGTCDGRFLAPQSAVVVLQG